MLQAADPHKTKRALSTDSSLIFASASSQIISLFLSLPPLGEQLSVNENRITLLAGFLTRTQPASKWIYHVH